LIAHRYSQQLAQVSASNFATTLRDERLVTASALIVNRSIIRLQDMHRRMSTRRARARTFLAN
jgi:hypothetical protein